MKSLLLDARAAVCAFLRRIAGSVSARLSTVFNSRPALKRGILVLVLYGLLAVPLVTLFGAALAALWALMLAAVFLGMGAERNSTDWDAVFALPALRHFKFWRWHALERKRYVAVLAALALGQILAFIMPVLWGLL